MAIKNRFVAKNGLDGNSNTIINIVDPVNLQDAATKNFCVKLIGSFNLTGITKITSSYQVLTTDNIILAAGTFNITMVNPANVTPGIPIYIKNIGPGVITILPYASETFDGYTGLTISVKNNSITLVTDGSNWYLI